MYEAVYAFPDGASTAARFAATAAASGFDGVVVRAVDAEPDYDRLRDAFDVDVVDGVEVVAANREAASGYLGDRRDAHTVLVVRGGTNELNRFAVEQPRVDVLGRPFADDGDVNHVVARRAAENDVRVEFDLGPVLRREGGARVQAIQKLRKLRELVEKYETPYVVSATPSSHLQVRAPRELAALGEVVGFTNAQIRDGLAEWGRVAATNQERQSESFISPGVKRERHEEDG